MTDLSDLSIRPNNLENNDLFWHRYFRELSDFQFPDLEWKLKEEGVITSKDKYRETFDEFKKYTSLFKISRGLYADFTPREEEGPIFSLDMPSTQVDAVWHQFILFSRQYERYCDKFVGAFVYHNPTVPSSKRDPKPFQNFLRLYEHNYGPVPDIWEIHQKNTPLRQATSLVKQAANILFHRL